MMTKVMTESLRTGYAAARLEIESLRGRSVPVSEADMVLAAMETGEWELQRLLPQTCFTSEANIRNAWSVKRSAAPYCTKDGLRIWTGATPLEALCNGAAALGVELPGCSETAALPKTVVAILGEQAELRRLSGCCPELNLSNYGPDDVDELNGWAIEVSQCIDRALAAQPAGAQAAPVVWRSWDSENSRWNLTLWPDEWAGHPDVWEPLDTTALLAQAQAGAVPLTDREIELIDGMIAVQLDHATRCDAIANRSMADKQKGWDMERVALLQKFKAHGIKGGQHGTEY